MISDLDLDRLLSSWLKEGEEQAPGDAVAAAIEEIGSTRQRRPPPLSREWLESPVTWRNLALVAAIGLLLAALAFATLGGLVTRDDSDVFPNPSVQPALPEALRQVTIPDWSVELAIPTGWSAVGRAIPEYRQFAGIDPEGSISASHESPYLVTVCDPDCADLSVTPTIPYSADRQLESLKHVIELRAASDRWQPLSAAMLEEVHGGARLESVSAVDGREWHRVYVAGLRDRNLVAITWAQPSDVFDEALLDRVLKEISLPPAPLYSDGDLGVQTLEQFAMPVPGLWATAQQPAADGVSLSGVMQFGEGEVIVSIGNAEGRLGWCDPNCRVLTGQTSLDALEASLRSKLALGPASEILLGGEPALALDRQPDEDHPSAIRRYVIAMHDGRPVALGIDTLAWDIVDPDFVDDMIDGFRFIDPVVAQPERTFALAEGRVEISLSGDWYRNDNDVLILLPGKQRLVTRVGGSDGSIVTCANPAGPWEQCGETTANGLEELVAAIQPAPIPDHGVGPPTGIRSDIVLDGEPAIVTRIQAYEYPAKSGQEVVYIAAFHDGRPYLVRIRTTANEVRDLGSIIAGFRFLD